LHVWYQPLSGAFAAGPAAPHPRLKGVMQAKGKVHDVTHDIERIIREMPAAQLKRIRAARKTNGEPT
ncbi:hypothetical protein, partial [Bacillus subtilis]|uniref:hypothetical protein n=1 Tax=Bacillus subtilis TaxID=1423 RepID=UPI003C1A5E79